MEEGPAVPERGSPAPSASGDGHAPPGADRPASDVAHQPEAGQSSAVADGGAASDGHEPAVTAALAARNITKRFPGVVANEGVTLDILPGEVHTLLGENGAGKTTLCNVLTGQYRPDEGHVEVRGVPVQFRSPREAHASGIFLVHQHFRLVQSMSVAENVILGWSRKRGQWFSPKDVQAEVAGIGERFNIHVDPKAKIWQLSVGEQQRVEILKALYRGARILILDEPTTVLAPQEVDQLFVTLRHMVADGATVVFISHKLPEVLAISDRVTVLRGGRNMGTVQTKESDAKSLARLMVGRDIELTRKEAVERSTGDVVLRLSGVGALGDLGLPALDDVSLEVRAGEILGVAGVAGNGQRELAEVIAGERPLTGGDVTIASTPIHEAPWEAIEAGLGYVPEERMGVGVAPGLTIADNLIVKSYREGGPIIHSKETQANAERLIERFDIVARGPKTIARELSGGNIQRVLLARELSGHPKVLVVASPTRGLDVSATDSVRKVLVDAAASGVGVLLISEDLDEVLDLSDRIAVMYRGAVAGIVDRNDADVDDIGLMMSGAKT
jgi:simple sugar transport system ATP-binding protein